MDKLGFWNVRGLNSPLKHGDIKWCFNHYNIALFRLPERRVKPLNFQKVFPKICNGWYVVTN